MTSKTEVPQTLVGPLLQRFFMEHLCNHKRLSPQTVKSYRDTFRLLLQYLQEGELRDVNSRRGERIIIKRRDPARRATGRSTIAGKLHDYRYTPVMRAAQLVWGLAEVPRAGKLRAVH